MESTHRKQSKKELINWPTGTNYCHPTCYIRSMYRAASPTTHIKGITASTHWEKQQQSSRLKAAPQSWTKWWSRRTWTHLLSWTAEQPSTKSQTTAEQPSTEKAGSTKREFLHPKTKKPQQSVRRGTFKKSYREFSQWPRA